MNRLMLALILCLLTVGSVSAADRPADKASQRIKKAYLSIRDLQGSFTQTSQIKELEQTQKAKGKFYIRRPDRVRWDYLEPEKQTAVLVGVDMMVKREGSDEVLKGTFDTASYGQTPIAILSGLGDMERDFIVKEDTPTAVVLEPRSNMGVIRSIRLVVGDGDFPIRSLHLVDLYGNLNDLVFSGVKLNRGLKDSLFVP